MAEKAERVVGGTTTKNVTVIEREGLIRGTISLAADVTEKICVESFGLVNDVRNVTFARINGAIDWIDGTQQAVMKLARTATGHTDSILDGALGATEAGIVGTVRMVRGAAVGATELASRATAAVAGRAPEAPAMRVA
jgi:hypothetical protein